MDLIIIFTIIFTHWFTDFVIQTHWQATNKSNDNKALTIHVFSYSIVWFLLTHSLIIMNCLPEVFYLFAPITFIAHWVTDYFTSRVNSKLWAKGDVHNFFVSVGFDQVLHYFQLFLTYKLLI